jgi:hypothetical protein
VPPDPQKIDQILPIKRAVEDKLIAQPGVTGVDVGLKEVGGEQTDTHAILVFVGTKGEFEPVEEVPPTIEGVPTDVIEATFKHHIGTAPPDLAPGFNPSRYDPMQGGASIAPGQIKNWYGTAGLLVIEESWMTEVPLWLGAYHVMCPDKNWWREETKILQPPICFAGKPSTDTIGRVRMGYFGETLRPTGTKYYLDCAVCEVTGRAYSKKLLGLNIEPRGAHAAKLGGMVKKYGASTGERQGEISSTEFTAKVDGAVFYFQYRAKASPDSGPPLSGVGDSGAAVIDEEGFAIGLIIAGDETTKLSIINPLEPILATMNLRIPK